MLLGTKPDLDRRHLTVKQVAHELGVSNRTVRNWIKAKRLAAKRVGGIIRILRSDLERAVKPII